LDTESNPIGIYILNGRVSKIDSMNEKKLSVDRMDSIEKRPWSIRPPTTQSKKYHSGYSSRRILRLHAAL